MENKDLLPKPQGLEQFGPTKSPETPSFSQKEAGKENIEQSVSQKKETAHSLESSIRKKFRLPTRRPTVIIPQKQDEITVKIEKVLEEGLGDAFQRLSPVAREEFKLKGEQTALKIRELAKSTHVKAKKVFQLILEWLRLLPGINRFFLEQEAKIKTDRILMINRDKRPDS